MPFIDITTNVPEYVSVIDLYGRARKKTHQEVINRTAAQANFRCVRGEASGGVKRAKLGKFPLNATANPEKGGTTYQNRFYYAHQASHGVKKGAGGNVVMRPKAFRAYTKRRSAKGAMAAGFLVSARKLGLKKRGAKSAQPVAGKSASKSTGRKASGILKSNSVNAVEGSFEVGKPAMDRAIRDTIQDMKKFANDMLQRTNNEFQPRR